MEKMRGSQGRQKPRPVSKGPGAGKTSDDGETAEPGRAAAVGRGRRKAVGSERQRSDKGLHRLRLHGRDPWVRSVSEESSGMLDPARTGWRRSAVPQLCSARSRRRLASSQAGVLTPRK